MKYFSQILGFYYQIFIDLTLLQHFYFCITFVNFHSILLSKRLLIGFWSIWVDFLRILSGFGRYLI